VAANWPLINSPFKDRWTAAELVQRSCGTGYIPENGGAAFLEGFAQISRPLLLGDSLTLGDLEARSYRAPRNLRKFTMMYNGLPVRRLRAHRRTLGGWSPSCLLITPLLSLGALQMSLDNSRAKAVSKKIGAMADLGQAAARQYR
jgi:hypothetical protein